MQRLGDHFAHDELTLDELELRLARAYRAERPDELEQLVADLPAPLPAASRRPAKRASSTAAVTPMWPESSTSSRSPSVGSEEPVDVDAERESQKSLVAIMGGVVRRGRWAVPRRIDAFAMMGGIELDLREASFASGVTEIHVVAIMGGLVLRVSPGMRVESDGVAIMGAFEDPPADPSAPTDGPLVRVTGLAIMGSVETTVALRGAHIPED